MPLLKDALEKSRALAEMPTLGNMHPNARTQALARQIAIVTDAERLAFLHSPNKDADGYEFGVARVKFDEHGQFKEFLWTASDNSDVDALILASRTPTEGSLL